jgi:hypothetical protein
VVAWTDPALAGELVEGARPTATRYRLAAVTARAVLAEATDDPAGAADLYAEAAEGWDAYGQALEHALAVLGRGRCLLRLGRDEAAATLRDAQERLSGLGARLFAEEVATLLDRATEGRA